MADAVHGTRVPDSQTNPPVPTRRAILSRMPAAAVALAAAGHVTAALASPAASDDHELISLGRELEAAWTRERAVVASLEGDGSEAADDAVDAAVDETSAVVDQIEAIPATSLAGLKVKARAVSWCHSGQPIASDAFNDQKTTDIRLAASIVRDLLASGGST